MIKGGSNPTICEIDDQLLAEPRINRQGPERVAACQGVGTLKSSHACLVLKSFADLHLFCPYGVRTMERYRFKLSSSLIVLVVLYVSV